MKLNGKTVKAKVRKLEAEYSKRGRDQGNASFKALSDEYKPEFEPIRLHIYDSHDKNGKLIKYFHEYMVQRFEEDGLPYVFISTYMESERYTGYCKGKSIHYPLEIHYDVMDKLTELSETCDKKKIE